MDQLIYTASHIASKVGESPTLLSALGINGTLLILQTIAFLLLIFILGKFAYPPLIKAVEDRRRTVEESIKNAKKSEEKLQGVEEKVADIIRSARGEANEILTHSQQEATTIVEAAEARAVKRAEQIVAEAQAQMKNELTEAHESMKREMTVLVAHATERIIKEKIDVQKDAALIESSLKEAQ